MVRCHELSTYVSTMCIEVSQAFVLAYSYKATCTYELAPTLNLIGSYLVSLSYRYGGLIAIAIAFGRSYLL